MSQTPENPEIPGTTLFDAAQARKGYALNKMCFSFNAADNRAAFLKDEEAYMRAYGLNPQQSAAIRQRKVLDLIAAGGNAYYQAKFAGIFGLDMQDIGAQQIFHRIEEYHEYHDVRQRPGDRYKEFLYRLLRHLRHRRYAADRKEGYLADGDTEPLCHEAMA